MYVYTYIYICMLNGNPLPHGHYSEKLGLTRQHLQ